MEDTGSPSPPPERGGFFSRGPRPQPPPPMYFEEDEIERLRRMVAAHFPVYDVQTSVETVGFFCTVDVKTAEKEFRELWREVKAEGYYPLMTHQNGEHVVLITRRPPARYRTPKLNLVFLILTLVSTGFTGLLYWASYTDPGQTSIMDALTLENAAYGMLFFSIPLMAILGVHELGHYYMARRHGVAASLPFFIPVPPPFLIGTLGAFISLREPIPDRKALIDIGAAGPLAGFAVAVPIAFIGLFLTGATPQAAPPNPGDSLGSIIVNFPLMFIWLQPFIALPENVLLHPLAFAGWAGFFVTALNLIPAGQLDGGHIARALLGDKSKYASYGATISLLILGVFYFSGWIMLGFLVLILGVRHPPPLNDLVRLGKKRLMVGLSVVLVFALCFWPVPIATLEPVYGVEATDGQNSIDFLELSAAPGTDFAASFELENVGNTYALLNLSFDGNALYDAQGKAWGNWSVFISTPSTSAGLNGGVNVGLNDTDDPAQITVNGTVPPGQPAGVYVLTVLTTWDNHPNFPESTLEIRITV